MEPEEAPPELDATRSCLPAREHHQRAAVATGHVILLRRKIGCCTCPQNAQVDLEGTLDSKSRLGGIDRWIEKVPSKANIQKCFVLQHRIVIQSQPTSDLKCNQHLLSKNKPRSQATGRRVMTDGYKSVFALETLSPQLRPC